MAIQRRTHGTTTAWTTSQPIPYSASATTGDVCYLVAMNTVMPGAAPTGWTSIMSGTANGYSVNVYKKNTNWASGDAQPTVTAASGTGGVAWIEHFYSDTAGKSVTEFNAQVALDTNTGNTTYSATGTSVTSVSNDWLVGWMGMKSSATMTANATAVTLSQASATLGTAVGNFGARLTSASPTNSLYYNSYTRPVTTGATGAMSFTATAGTGGANAAGPSALMMLREVAAYVSSPNEPVGITDSAPWTATAVRVQDDPEAITDAASQVQESARALPDGVGVTDSVSAVIGMSALISDVVGLTDSASSDLVASQATFRDWTGIQTSTNNQTVTRPGTVQNNDYEFIATLNLAGSGAPDTPSGWTVLVSDALSGTGNARFSLLSRRYQTGDPTATLNWSSAPGSGNNFTIFAFWYANVPIGQNPSAGSVGNSSTNTTTYTAPSKTTSLAGRRMLTIGAMNGGGSGFPTTVGFSPDAVWRAQRTATANFFGTIAVGDWIAGAAGATTAQTVTFDTAYNTGFAVQVEVPSGTGSVVDRQQDDPVGISDALSLTGAYDRTLNDPTGIADVVVPVVTSERLPADAVGITDNVSAILAEPQATYRDGVAIEGITTQIDFTFPIPVAVQENDWGTIVMIAGEGSDPPVAPSGWATMYEGLSGGGTARMSVYGKRFQTGDLDPEVSYPGAPSTGNNITGVAFWYYNVPVGQTPTLGTVGTSASATNVYTAPSKVTATPNRRVVSIGALKGGGTGAPTTGTWAPDATTVLSIFASANYYSGIVIGEFMKATAGATNAQTITWNDSRTSGFAVQMEVPSGAVAAYDRAPADPVGITDTVTAGWLYVVNLSESIGIIDTDDEQIIDIADESNDPVGITDSVGYTLDEVTSAADPVGITDVASVTGTASRTVPDAVGVTDTTTVVSAADRTAADPVGITDAVDISLSGTGTQNLNDPVGITDSATMQAVADRSLSDPVGISDVVTSPIARVTAPSDPVGVTDSLATVQAIVETQPDPVGITDSVSAVLTADGVTADTVGITDSAVASMSSTQTAADNVGITDSLSGVLTTDLSVADSVALSDTVSVLATGVRLVGDPVGIADSAVAGLTFDRAPSDPLGITDSVTGLLSNDRAVTDPVGITDVVSVVVTRFVTIADGVALNDAVVLDFIGVGFALVPDQVDITDALDSYWWANKTANDPVGITDLLSTGLDRDLWMETDYVGISDALSPVAGATRATNDAVAIYETLMVSQDTLRPPSDPVGVFDAVSAVLAVGELGEPAEDPGTHLTDRFGMRLRPYADEVRLIHP